MSTSLREIGTLIVVVLKANHLPNKRHIGKQDPYCLATVNGEKKRTKAIKRGGQHPEWDEELRFTLLEDDDDLSVTSTPGTPPPLPPKDARSLKKIQGGNTMKIACYADDPREPDLIGETEVDLTEVLTKGETDEWFTLSNKDKFAGKVYLELTFWSNAPPPEKKVTPKPPKASKQYAGPGSFVPSNESPSRIGPSGVYAHSRPPSDASSVAVPSSLRASSSLAKLDLYVPPYEKPTTTVIDQIANEFNEMGISQHRRRESFPPVQYGYTTPAVASNPYLGDSIRTHDHPSNTHDSHLQQYHYDQNQPSVITRNSRLPSMPVTSSGFMPLNNTSTFLPSTHASDIFTYPPPHSHTPTLLNSVAYQPTTNYLPPQIPLPPHNNSYIPSTTPTPYAPPVFQPQLQHYSPYPPSQTPTPPQQYGPPVIPPQGHSQSPYSAYQSVSSSSHESISASNSASSTNSASRPLPPEPHIVYASSLPSIGQPTQEGIPPPPPALPLPPPPPPMQYSQIPPPPPIPNPLIYPVNGGSPIPPPPPLVPTQIPRRRTSLPVPPGPSPPQQSPYQPPPPPPLPVNAAERYSTASMPLPPLRSEPSSFSPGPPPKPPVQLEGHTPSQTNGTVQNYLSVNHVPNYV